MLIRARPFKDHFLNLFVLSDSENFKDDPVMTVPVLFMPVNCRFSIWGERLITGLIFSFNCSSEDMK